MDMNIFFPMVMNADEHSKEQSKSNNELCKTICCIQAFECCTTIPAMDCSTCFI